jgi:dihydrofolate reductase
MGRKTFESIVALIGKPLPDRSNVVVTRDKDWQYDGAFPADSIEEAIQLAKHKPGSDEIFIIGGGEIYALGIGYADKLYLTLIDDEKEADSFFPDYATFKTKVHEEARRWNGLQYRWVDLVR